MQVQYVPLPEGMAYDGGLYKQMPALVRDIKLNVSVVRRPALLLTIQVCMLVPWSACSHCPRTNGTWLQGTARCQLEQLAVLDANHVASFWCPCRLHLAGL